MLDNSNVAPGKNKTLRCAIYTRKSHEEGLEQEFNSLDAQRESAEHYIEAQRMRGWTALPDRYDDGGFSGGNMERPGLRRLLADIDAGKIDVIVVYKVDRLSRSLLDFMKMIDLFNEKGVSFVSVTQHFCTIDPTGRMFLGILITFAQYERKVIAERIRDKVQAILEDNKPVKVSMARTKMVAPLKGVIRCGHCGCSMGPTYARKNGRHYTYYICQKDSKRTVSRCPLKRIPAGDIEQAERERLFKQKAQLEMELSQAREQALELMKPSSDQPGKAEMLTTVNRQAVELSKQLTHVSERCRAYQGNSITEQDVSEAFQNVEGFWEDLFPVERNRLIRLLVDKVEIRETGIDMELRTNGLTTLIAELAGLACEVTERRASR